MPGFSYNGTITLSSSVKDLDTSIAWFEDVLGFEEVFKVAEAGWAEVSTPAEGVSIGLDQTDADAGASGGSIPVFGVVDIDAARASARPASMSTTQNTSIDPPDAPASASV